MTQGNGRDLVDLDPDRPSWIPVIGLFSGDPDFGLVSASATGRSCDICSQEPQMIDITSRWESDTAREMWIPRRTSFLAKAKATKVVWFPAKRVMPGKKVPSTSADFTGRTIRDPSGGAASWAIRKPTGGVTKVATRRST
jgi:hypothetical protein